MGVVSKQTDYRELLNNRYEMIPKEVDNNPTFLTNPAILINTYYEISKQQN
jgi:hypothetical protein